MSARPGRMGGGHDLVQIALGSRQQLLAFAPAFGGQKRVAAGNEPLARVVWVANLAQILLIEQRQLQRVSVITTPSVTVITLTVAPSRHGLRFRDDLAAHEVAPTIDTSFYMANNQAMKMANIAEFKNRLSQFIAAVERGEEVEIRRRNLPIARVVPVNTPKSNGTKLGCGRGTAKVTGDPTAPLIPEGDWEMFGNGGS